jgi:beta-galactosidase
MKEPLQSSYFGIVDLAGLPKDRYYLYQSKWSDKPVFHVLPHWTWPRLNQKFLFLLYHHPKAELFVNGKSMGVDKRQIHYLRYRLMDDVIYEPEKLKWWLMTMTIKCWEVIRNGSNVHPKLTR